MKEDPFGGFSMRYPQSYKAKLPLELYAKLLETYPFVLGESEGD